MASPQPRLYSIELQESEKVVPRGIARQTWTVHYEGRWTPARLVPGAQVAFRPSGSGFVWSRIVSLKLAAGVRLELTRESPRTDKPSSTFKILTLDQKSNTLRRKILHEITGEGHVVPVPKANRHTC